ncbi:hypothetical protein [Streptomyces sp. NPDC020362]|uniref:hypothetical protein n=1 Tax=unclassified Streptomyces TaxID=2593676 RepID=UPI00340DCCB0
MRVTTSVGQDKGTRLVRWSDESGEAYGEEPYGGVGYAYPYSHEYGGDVTGGTASPPPDEARTAQWVYPTGQTATEWDSPHGDLLTAQLSMFDIPVPSVPEPDAHESESGRPVFVDSSGRRQRRVLRAARLLVIPAGVYVALLISTLLGGPSVSAPFVPQAEPTHPATHGVTAPGSSSGTGHSAKSVSPTAARKKSRTAAQKAPGAADRPDSTTPAPTSTAAPTTTTSPTSTTAPVSTAVRAPSSKGRALGSSHRPVK